MNVRGDVSCRFRIASGNSMDNKIDEHAVLYTLGQIVWLDVWTIRF